MCLIIYKPEGSTSFTTAMMKASIDRNSDGAGVMYIKDGRVVVDKIVGGTENTPDVIHDWCQRYYDMEGEVIIHHRMSTDGVNSLDNCHPYKVLSIDDGDPFDLYMMHNGIISACSTSITDTISDTRKYVEEYLQPMLKLCPELIHLDVFHQHMDSFIGSSSKLIFLINDGTVYIVNEDAGKWQVTEGEDPACWISNTYSITPPAAVWYQKPYTPPANQNVVPFGNSTKKNTTLPQSCAYNEHTYRQPSYLPYGREALAHDYGNAYDYDDDDLTPSQDWASMDIEDIAEYLLEIGYPIRQITEVVETLTAYDVTTLIESLLHRIYSKDYE